MPFYRYSGPLASSEEKTNGAKLNRLIIDGGTTVLRSVFDTHHPPANLAADLSACYTTLANLLRRRILNGHQWDKLFPVGGAAPDSNTFDISLLFLLLTNICGITPPHTGWHCKPSLSDTSHEANLARIKFFRNQVFGHMTTTAVETPVFNALWKEISAVLVALGLSQAEIDRLKAERCGEEDYRDALQYWAQCERDLKTQLNEMRQLLNTVQRNVEENKSIPEDLGIQQSATQRAVNETESRMDDIPQIATEIPGPAQRNTDQENEISKKLESIDSQRDVRDYTKRYLEGTRESFFAKINSWLDDASSPNRVLLLSRKAGMGKSVIAAEMCRKLQGSGRLAGSHFCHHGRVRHRNPKVMLQSLAHHLSCCLPEYKKALVEQLSGNQGVKIYNMEVVDLFDLLFLEPLNRVADPGFTSLVVIDALDESEYQGRNDLLDVIASLFKDLPLWLRFFVTTRPEVNIWDSLKDFQPLRLEVKDEDNLKDIRFYFKRSLSGLLEVERHELVVDDLVQKSEGVFLCAQFLVDFIRTKCSTILTLEQMGKTLPEGLSYVYQSYFQRLEQDLCKGLNITEEQFLCFLSAIAAAREPLPLGFVPKLLCSSFSSSTVMRKVSDAIAIVPSLLPVHDDRIHFFHKSVKEWLTEKSSYRQQSFSVEEMKGHKFLSYLCSNEFDELKRSSVSNSQYFTDTTRYALEHGVQHMLQLDQDMTSCTYKSLVWNYVLDPELLYAKLCVNMSAATEGIVGVMKHGAGLKTISRKCQETLSSLLVLLKKHRETLRKYPFSIFQCLLNEGSSKLSSDSRQLLETKYSDKPYVECVHKNDLQGAVQTQYFLSSPAVCLDVSPSLEYMVCECRDATIQLWSLACGNLKWKRFDEHKQQRGKFCGALRTIPADGQYQPVGFQTSTVHAFYRSVVFHPTKDIILPGVLSHAYTLNGDVMPLFPTSKCSFSVCSICGDEMLADFPDDAKCLRVWNLTNGREVDRVNSDKDILSFAMSRDGKLVAISHSMGFVCLLDRKNGFSPLAEATLESMCGMIRFSPDCRFLWCSCVKNEIRDKTFCLRVTEEPEHLYSMDFASVPKENSFVLDSHRIPGFLLGDPLSLQDPRSFSDTVLNSQCLLRNHTREGYVEMIYRNPLKKKTEFHGVDFLRFSLTGETVYTRARGDLHGRRIMTWDVWNGELKGQKEFGNQSFFCRHLVALKEGILVATKSTLELWNFDFSVCMQRRMFAADAVFSISDDQVACVTHETRDGIILDTVGGEVTFKVPCGKLIACYRKLQVFASNNHEEEFIELKQLGKSEPLWRALQGTARHLMTGSFSPDGQFIVVFERSSVRAYVLDTVSGRVRHELSDQIIHDCKFISNEECVFLNYTFPSCHRLRLFNVGSGDLLSVMNVDMDLHVPHSLATCPRRRLIAICSYQQFIIFVHSPVRGQKGASFRSECSLSLVS